MFIIIPQCPNCKTSKNVTSVTADVYADKTWFRIVYCTKCYEVIECTFMGRMMSKCEWEKEKRELAKARKERLKKKWYGDKEND